MVPGFWFDLRDNELPAVLVRPAVESCRLLNGLVDAIFYNVPGLIMELAKRDRTVKSMQGAKRPSRIIDLDALTNPEGCLLLIGPTRAPYTVSTTSRHS